MTRIRSFVGGLTLSLPFALLAMSASAIFADDTANDEFAKQPTWSVPAAATVRSETFKWLDGRKVDAAVRKQAEDLWPTDPAQPPPAAVVLERVVKTLALGDPQARELVDLCAKPKAAGPLPKFAWLADDKTPAFERNNLRLWYGRWLAQERLYDYSLDQLAGLEPADVADPATLLFYQSVANHWLLHKGPGLKTIGRLLERKKSIAAALFRDGRI